MKIIKRLSAIIFTLIVSNAVYAKNECENPLILQELKAHLNKSIYDEASSYLLLRSRNFYYFSIEYFNQKRKSGNGHLGGLKAENISNEGYKNIYQDISKKFVAAYTEGEIHDTQENIGRVADQADIYGYANFQVLPGYEHFLSTVVQQQFEAYRDDLIKSMRGEKYNAKVTLDKKTDDQLRSMISQRFKFKYNGILQNNVDSQHEYEIIGCQMHLDMMLKKPIEFQYSVYHNSVKSEVAIVPTWFKVNGKQVNFESVGQSLIEILENK